MIRAAVLAVVCLTASAGAAAAQGNGHGHAYGLLKPGGVAPPSGGAAQVQPSTAAGVRNFGSWLDDASVIAPGVGWLTLSCGWFKSPLFQEFDAPVADGGIGLTRRVQFGFSVPYYHLNQPGGPTIRGVGDLYLSSKVQLREPSGRRGGLGLAVIPIVEVLSDDPIAGRRFNWAAPLTVELQRRGWRTFGTAGYFSQGSVFASGALERSVAPRLSLTATLTTSHSTIADDPAIPLSRTRTDASGGATYTPAPGVAVFASLGRTLSQQDANAATLVVSGGLSFGFDAWRQGSRR